MIETRYDVDRLEVHITLTSTEHPYASAEPGELFDAGVALIEASDWLMRAQNDRSRARIVAIAHNAKVKGAQP